MGSSHRKNSVSEGLQLVTVDTKSLKDRLNRLYDTMRQMSKTSRKAKELSRSGLFEYLWDLKEGALMEGKAQVEVPTAWMLELDLALGAQTARRGH
jgi:hypothetical protein